MLLSNCPQWFCSKRRFQEQQAEVWWKENKDRLLRRYSPASNTASTGSSSTPAEAPPSTAVSPSAPAESSTTAAEDTSEAGPSET